MSASKWRSWIALTAAYVLAVQTVLVTVSLGAQAVPAFDATVHILCSGAAVHQSDGPAEPNGTHQSGCCTLGCSMFGAVGAPSAAAAVFEAPLLAGRTEHRSHDEIVVAGQKWSPGNPRAPPLTLA